MEGGTGCGRRGHGHAGTPVQRVEKPSASGFSYGFMALILQNRFGLREFNEGGTICE